MASRFENLELLKPGADEEDITDQIQAGIFAVREETSAHHHIQEAIDLELTGMPEKALRAYSRAIGEDPLLIDAWVGQLQMLLMLDQQEEAELWSAKALEHFPNNPQILACQAVAIDRMGRFMEAKSLCDHALTCAGDYWTVWLCRAELMIRHNTETARACFDKAIELAANKAQAGLRAGLAWLRHKRYQQALAVLQDTVSLGVQAAGPWYALGEVRMALGFRAQSQQAFAQAAEINPQSTKFRTAAMRRGTFWGDCIGRCRRLFKS